MTEAVLLDQDVKSKRYHLLQTHGDSFVGSFEEQNATASGYCVIFCTVDCCRLLQHQSFGANSSQRRTSGGQQLSLQGASKPFAKERNFLRHVLEEGNQSFGVRP